MCILSYVSKLKLTNIIYVNILFLGIKIQIVSFGVEIYNCILVIRPKEVRLFSSKMPLLEEACKNNFIS